MKSSVREGGRVVSPTGRSTSWPSCDIISDITSAFDFAEISPRVFLSLFRSPNAADRFRVSPPQTFRKICTRTFPGIG